MFSQAVTSVDSGDLVMLQELVEQHPRLVREPLDLPEEGYFQHHYLIWFVADNPIRNPTLPENIVDVTRFHPGRSSPFNCWWRRVDYSGQMVFVFGQVSRICLSINN